MDNKQETTVDKAPIMDTKVEKVDKELYFKISDGVGTRSVAIDKMGLSYRYLEEKHYYCSSELGVNAQENIDKLLNRKEWIMEDKYRNDIGIAKDKYDNTPISGKDSNGKDIYGIPRKEVPIIVMVTKKEYDQKKHILSKSKPNKATPWIRGVH